VKEAKCPLCGGKGKIIYEDDNIIVIRCIEGHRRITKGRSEKYYPSVMITKNV